ncbi:unnamed protein product [Rotaria sp. Silwood1]|nr:unnamed protein product [Rotaria sp. Silwood1]CAF3695427.1 unnamed protein product [Rotaria sp. Silwood1]CAF3781515.1 unnamed protein product [Rotaria sp. Silwood1]CAF4707103.1 unnamed protein product [Rotaria sp. Silwood1]CAF4746205.1 unnamed protein product [Rotaria sp. Silwood1]
MSLSALLFSLLIIGYCSASKCGSNCPSNKCPSCPCGTTTNFQDIATWCAKFSDWDQACCRCIVKEESNGNANAAYYNSAKLGFDVGLWQINEYWNWKTCSGGKAPCDPKINLECAKKVWREAGKSFRRWSTAAKCGCS